MFFQKKTVGISKIDTIISTPRTSPTKSQTIRALPEPEEHIASKNEENVLDGEYVVITDPDSGESIKIYGRIYMPGMGQLAPDQKAQMYCVYTDRGEFFVSSSQISDISVRNYEARLKRLGQKILPAQHVSLKAIKEIYAGVAATSTITAKAGQDTRMRRAFLEIVQAAADMGASDIHITANRDGAIVEMRIDGNMRFIKELPAEQTMEMLAASYTLADAADSSYQPFQYQAARIAASAEVQLPVGVQALRLQWNPLANMGRYMVARLLYSGKRAHHDLDTLGYSPGQLILIKHMRQIPIGINVFSGPTGSGKSTTLKTALQALIHEKNREVNVLTVEDPPEYVIEGAKQMPVTNAKTAEERTAAFQDAIRASLRSDPTVIMIGEIRDRESAKLAFEGAMTGHQIWTTLHTNSAIDIIDRLRDIGVEAFKLFDHTIVRGLVGQRLIPRLCPNCKISFEDAIKQKKIDQTVIERTRLLCSQINSDLPLYHRGNGCRECGNGNGYKGRTVVAEIIIPDARFTEILQTSTKEKAREYWLTEMILPGQVRGATILTHAIGKMLRGQIAPADIEREVGLLIYEEWMDDLFKDANRGIYSPVIA